MSPYPSKSSVYYLHSTQTSANGQASTFQSHWVTTGSTHEQISSIGASTTATISTTSVSAEQSDPRNYGNNYLPIPFTDSSSLKPPDPNYKNAYDSLSSIVQSQPGGGISARNPENCESDSSRGNKEGQVQDSTQQSEVYEGTDAGTQLTATVSARTNHSLKCPKCPKSFTRRHELKYVPLIGATHSSPLINISSKHFKTHDRSFKCTEPGCAFRGCYRPQDLNRHILGSHKKGDSQTKIFCKFPDCAMARKGFSRRDNYVRHIRHQHPASLELLEP